MPESAAITDNLRQPALARGDPLKPPSANHLRSGKSCTDKVGIAARWTRRRGGDEQTATGPARAANAPNSGRRALTTNWCGSRSRFYHSRPIIYRGINCDVHQWILCRPGLP